MVTIAHSFLILANMYQLLIQHSLAFSFESATALHAKLLLFAANCATGANLGAGANLILVYVDLPVVTALGLGKLLTNLCPWDLVKRNRQGRKHNLPVATGTTCT